MTLAKAENFLQLITNDLDSEQVEYLSWRICGFTSQESLQKAKVQPYKLKVWELDKTFQLIEKRVMGEVRAKFAEEIIHQKQIRNTLGMMELDSRAISEGLEVGLEGVSDATRQWLMMIRNRYVPEVRKYLGLDEERQLNDWDEVMIHLRRSPQDADTKIAPQNYIEGEYQESAGEQEGEEIWPEQDDLEEETLNGD